VKSGHNDGAGVTFEAGKIAGTGINDDSFNKRFVKRGLLGIIGNEVDGATGGNCGFGTGVTGEPHG